MITTNNSKIADQIRTLRAHGIPPSSTDRDCSIPGHNYRMSDIIAATLTPQLNIIDKLNKTRACLAKQLTTEIEADDALVCRIMPHLPGTTGSLKGSVYQMFSLVVDSFKNNNYARNFIISYLQREGVDARSYFDPPVHKQKYYDNDNFRFVSLHNTEKLAETILQLPFYHSLSSEDIIGVVDLLSFAVKEIDFAVRKMDGGK